MAAKPIKTLELHYTMIQFLIIMNITVPCKVNIKIIVYKFINILNVILCLFTGRPWDNVGQQIVLRALVDKA